MEDEYAEKARRRKKSGLRPLLPALGFVLIVAFGGIAYVVGPPIAAFAGAQLKFAVTREIEYVFMAATFAVLLVVAAVIIAIATPKQKTDKLSTDQQMRKEKAEMERERLARKARQREAHRREAEARRRSSR